MSTLPPEIPPEAVSFLEKIGYFESDRLHTGDPVPPLSLQLLNGSGNIIIGAPETARPVVLIFGSYT
jgi:hypothetical protein